MRYNAATVKLASFESIVRASYRCRCPLSGYQGACREYLRFTTAEQFADHATRARRIREKNMQVLRLWNDLHRETSSDIFVQEPVLFDAEYAKALVKPLYETIDGRLVSIPTLIAMTEGAGREQQRSAVPRRWTRRRIPSNH